MTDWPLVSIAITAFNYAHMLRDAIESARRQTYPNLEILVLDNASTDETPALVAEYAADPRIRYVRHAVNIGMVANHNAAIELARGEYLSYLSADDILLPDYVLASYQFLQANPGCDLAYSGVFLSEPGGHIVTRRWRSDEIGARHVGPPSEFARLLADGCWIYFSSVLIKRSVYQELGGFEEGYIACDYDMLVRWTKAGIRIGDVGRTLSCARIHPGNQSSPATYSALGRELAEMLDFLEKHIGESDYARIDGFENGIIYGIERRLKDVQMASVADRTVLQTRAIDQQDRMRAIAAINYPRPIKPVITCILICEGPLNAVDVTIRSLLEQTYADWELIVLASGDTPLDDMCAYADPQGRVRALSLVHALPTGRAIANAVRVARGNAFIILRAGSVLPQNHIAESCTLLESDPRAIVVHPARLLVVDPAGAMNYIDGTYPAPDRMDLLPIAPVLPVEAIVFTRRFFDRYELNRRNGTLYSYWEMMLAALPTTPLCFGHSRVIVTSFTGTLRDLGMVQDIRTYAELLHAAIPQQNSRILAARTRYLRDLDNIIERMQANPHNPAMPPYAHSVFSGVALAEVEMASVS